MPLESNEVISLVPILSLAVVYWWRDRYRFNRTPERWYTATRTQIQILMFVYPVWVYLQWIQNLQIRRRSGMAFVTTLGTLICGHYSTVGILNDSLRQTQQQFVSFVIGLGIYYTWTVVNFLSFASEEGSVSHNASQVQCVCDGDGDHNHSAGT